MTKAHSALFDHAYAVIIAGGAGTRLWPLSRQSMPKQFHILTGERTLLQATYDRLATVFPADHILTLVTAQYQTEVANQLTSLPKENILIEPTGRNTAAATALASHTLYQRDPDAVVALVPSDHAITKPKAFLAAMTTAIKAATEHPDYITSLGIEPTSPQTGYGYIKIGKRIGESSKIFAVEKFVEKPDLARATRYVTSRRYLWNGGYYIFRADTMNQALAELAPDIATKIAQLDNVTDIAKRLAIYETIEKNSIDYAVSEKYPRLLVVAANMGWSDIGTWGSLHEVLKAQEGAENVIKGEHVGLDNENVFVLGDNKLIATVGLKDVIIVDTPDVLLICNRENEQDIKKVLEHLRQEGKEIYL